MLTRRLRPDSWDMIFLGWDLGEEAVLSCASGLQFSIRSSASGTIAPAASRALASGASALGYTGAVLRVERLLGLGAYLLSPAGARELLERCSDSQGPLAEAVAGALGALRGFAYFPPLAVSMAAAVSVPHGRSGAEAVEAASDCTGILSGSLAAAGIRAEVPAVVHEAPAVAAGGAGGAVDAATSFRAGLRPAAEVWQVIGGQGLGGILVRGGAGLTSSTLGRLQLGAVIQQEERDGTRLHFTKLFGDGPSRGWVSTVANGKELLRILEADDFARCVPSAGSVESSTAMGGSLSSAELRWRETLDLRRKEEAKQYRLRRRVAEEELRQLGEEGGADAVAGVTKKQVGRESPVSKDSTNATELEHHELEDHDSEVVELWARGDFEKAWWRDAGGARPRGSEGQLRAWIEDVEGSNSRDRSSTLGFHIPDNDPDEVHEAPDGDFAADFEAAFWESPVGGQLPVPTTT